MKKIYSFMVAAVALFAAVSCNKEIEQDNLPAGETVVYTASVDGADDVKAVLNQTTKKSEWTATDKITVLDGSQSWTFNSTGAGQNVDFTNSEDFGSYRPVMAVYPAGNWTANVTAKTVTANIPTAQQAQAGTYHDVAALAVAYSETNSFAFKNAAALLKFTVGTDNVTHLIFHGNDSESVTGDVTVVLGDEGVESVTCLETAFVEDKWNDETQQNDKVTVMKYGTWAECYAYHDADNKYFDKTKTYYLAVAPQTFNNGVTVKIKINDGGEIVAKTTDKKVVTKANTILDLGTIEYVAPETVKTVYLKPGVWAADNAWFSAHFYSITGGTSDVKMTDSDSDGIYEAAVPAGMDQVIFCRMNPEYNSFAWNSEAEPGHIWTEMGAQSLPLAGAEEVCFVLSDWEAGSWKTMEEATAGPKPGLDSDWALAGTFNGWGDLVFETTSVEELFVAKNVVLDAYDEIKVKAVGSWGTSFGGGIINLQPNKWMTVYDNGQNIPVTTAGTYDVYFDHAGTKLYLVTAGTDHTSASQQTTNGPASTKPAEWYIVGTFNDWDPGDANYRMSDDGTYYVFKNFTAPSGCQMKFAPGKWSGDKGGNNSSFATGTWFTTGGSNITVNQGTYDVYLKKDLSQYKFVSPGQNP